MKENDNRYALYIFLGIILFLFYVGVNSILSFAKAPDRTSVETSEDATLTDAKRQLQELNVQRASDTSALYDRNAYLTFSNESAGPAVSEIQILTGIYRMSISIRNLLLVLICMIFLSWTHKTLKASVFRFVGKGMK